MVQRFEVERSQILSDADLRGALAPFENRTLSLNDLFEEFVRSNLFLRDRLGLVVHHHPSLLVLEGEITEKFDWFFKREQTKWDALGRGAGGRGPQ